MPGLAVFRSNITSSSCVAEIAEVEASSPEVLLGSPSTAAPARQLLQLAFKEPVHLTRDS